MTDKKNNIDRLKERSEKGFLKKIFDNVTPIQTIENKNDEYDKLIESILGE